MLIGQVTSLFTNAALAWAGLAAVSLPLVIHLLTRWRRQSHTWGAMRFLLEAFRRHRVRLRLEQWLLLVVRCLIPLLLGLALAGPRLSAWTGWIGAGWGESNRLIYLVLDDSLTSQATQVDDQMRFDHLRQTAQAVVAALQPGDQLALWLAAHPQRVKVPIGPMDRAAATRLLSELQPRFARSALPAALAQISQDLAERPSDPSQAWVIVLSDWSAGTLGREPAAAASLRMLGQQARVLALQPMPEARNVQIQALIPRRSTLLCEAGGSARIPLEIKLRRFGQETAAATTVHVSLNSGQEGEAITLLEREHRWSPGQTQAALNVEVPLNAPSVWGGATGITMRAKSIALEARVETPADSDALAADNRRWVVVELRRRLRVGLADETGSGALLGSTTIPPRRWLSAALAPRGSGDDSQSPVELVDLDAGRLEPSVLESLDALMVLRPDRLTPGGFTTLRQFVGRGGLVWLFMPAVDGSTFWARSLRESWGLDWQLAMEAAGPGSREEAPTRGMAPEGIPNIGWQLSGDQPAPAELGLLAADWQALLRPVRVLRRVDLTVPEGSPGVWLWTEDRRPLLIGAPLGDGYVLLLATAIDPAWTNLPTKPLFVPLLHEALRSVVGRAGAASAQVTCGEAPRLSPQWEGAEQIARRATDDRVLLQRVNEGFVPVQPLEHPGIYQSAPLQGRLLAVNLEADAGDTRAGDPQRLADWLSAVGADRWLNAEQLLRAVAQLPQPVNLGGPLLWLVLALVLLESCLARWFSHARVQTGSSARRWRQQLMQLVRG